MDHHFFCRAVDSLRKLHELVIEQLPFWLRNVLRHPFEGVFEHAYMSLFKFMAFECIFDSVHYFSESSIPSHPFDRVGLQCYFWTSNRTSGIPLPILVFGGVLWRLSSAVLFSISRCFEHLHLKQQMWDNWGEMNLLLGRTHDNLAWASSHQSNLDMGKSNEYILYPQGNWYTCQDKKAVDEQGMTSTLKILLYKFEVES